MSADVVLINPPYENIAKGQNCVKHIVNSSPSLGLLLLAGQLRQDGYEVAILECDIEHISIDEAVRRTLELRPKVAGITLFTVGVQNGALIAEGLKKADEKLPVIVGGPHVSSMGVETMERFTAFDLAVLHEGEAIITEIVQNYERGASQHNVPGVLYRQGEEVAQTPSVKNPADLDELPLPAWDLLPNFPQNYPLAIFGYPKGPVATFSASRGCPFKCSFCDTTTFGKKIRYYSPEKVFAIMRHLQERYGVRHLQFVDDLFVANRKRITQLCDLIIDSGFTMSWSCTARVDTITPEVLGRMKRAGCWEISYGLESGSERMLENMRKATTAEQAERAVNWTHEAGIRCKGLFMLGYPGEDEESIAVTKAFVRRLPMTTMNMTKFTPYPGTPVYKELYGTAIRKQDWERMNGMNFIYEPDSVDMRTLDREYEAILTGFYKRGQVVRDYLQLAWHNPLHLWRLVKMLGCRVRQRVGI